MIIDRTKISDDPARGALAIAAPQWGQGHWGPASGLGVV